MKRALGFMNKALPISYNTYIGGISATVGTDALLATKLGISVGAISNFTVVGSDIKCKITGSYGISNSAFQFNTTPSTYYIDSDYLVTSIGSDAFYSTNIAGIINFQNATAVSSAFRSTPLLTEILLKNCASVGDIGFAEGANGTQMLKVCYIPSCTSLGSTVGNNSVFNGSKSFLKIYAHPSLATNNGGGVDGDLADAISRGATVRYVTNFIAPNPVTTLAAGTAYENTIQLNFTPPSSTNTIDYYECYANGVFKNNISASGGYILGLTSSTSYDITVLAVDIFYNKSTVSNTVTQSTNTTVSYLTGLVSWYKLDEAAGIAYDSYGSAVLGNNNITCNQIGKIGKSFKSTAAFQYLSGTVSAITGNFSINFWCYRTGNPTLNDNLIVAHGDYGAGGFGVWINQLNYVGWIINNNYNNYSSLVVPPLNTWVMITVVYNGTNVRLYMDSVLKTTTVNTTNPTSNTTRRMFNRGSQSYIGHLDEVAFYNQSLTQTQIDLLYNSGTGITL